MITLNECKKLLGLMAASAIDQCMGGHFYTIGGNIRRQQEGGEIGSDLTGELARIYMLQCDQRFLDRCKNLGILLDMYNHYLDEMTIIPRLISRGWRFCGKQ